MNRNLIARWAIALIAIASMSGCVVYPYGYGHGRYRHEFEEHHVDRPVQR
jgi:hypothetical protein